MAKRIEFLAPVESMRGNLSGSQDLVYAENDNRAYEAPADRTNYARNYQTRYIGNKRSSDGLKYFGVKTKSAVTTSANAMLAMAAMGGAAAVYNAMKAAGGRKWEQVQYNYEESFKNYYKSLRQYAMNVIMQALRAKTESITFGGPTVATYPNPWRVPTQTDLNIGDRVLTKFWTELARNGVQFFVNGQIGVGNTTTAFDGIIADNPEVPNVLGLTTQTVGGTIYVQQSGMFLMYDATTYVVADDLPVNNHKYFLSSVGPA